MAGKKKEDGTDDSIGGFKTRSYNDSEFIKANQDIYQFTAKEKKKKRDAL